MKRFFLLCAGVFLGLGLPLAASAQINISATVANACSFGSVNVTLDGAAIAAGSAVTNTASSVNLTCNKGATVSVALSDGANASGTQKRLSSGAGFISYNLSRPNALVDGGPNTCPTLPGTEWNGTNTVNASALFNTSGGPKAIPVCLSVPAGQFPSPGTYTDTVTATLTVS